MKLPCFCTNKETTDEWAVEQRVNIVTARHMTGTCVYKSTIDQYTFTTRVRPRDLHSIAVSKVKAKGKVRPIALLFL